MTFKQLSDDANQPIHQRRPLLEENLSRLSRTSKWEHQNSHLHHQDILADKTPENLDRTSQLPKPKTKINLKYYSFQLELIHNSSMNCQQIILITRNLKKKYQNNPYHQFPFHTLKDAELDCINLYCQMLKSIRN